jgi:hypothetical protein
MTVVCFQVMALCVGLLQVKWAARNRNNARNLFVAV